jgi:CheY-like chemotaxis protein
MDNDLAHSGRLLLVDDNQDNLEVLVILLGQYYTVAGYGSAAEALEALDTVKPDVLVLDIGMSPVDGVQCLEAIRARPGYGDVPAVALTAFARPSERNEFLDAGFQAVVAKPVLDPDALAAVIDKLLAAAASPPARSAPRPLGHRRDAWSAA